MMNFDIFFIVCLIVALPRDIKSSELIDDALAAVIPHSSNTTDRQRELIRAADDHNYVVMNTVGLVEQCGYSATEHTITTADGYNIKIFRISPKSTSAEGKPVVYIQHGILSSSDGWVLIGSGYDLALLLADHGYDVWLGNVRGNSYGISHNNLTTNDKQFWNHNLQEISTLDLAAAVDYVLKETGQTDLNYIGHSMGTTMSYILLSEMPEYNKKIRLSISLAPSAFYNKQNLNLAIRVATDFTDLTRDVCNFLGIYELLPQRKYTIVRKFCSAGSPVQFICVFVLSVLFGRDPEDFNWDLVPYIGLYNPAGISMNIFYHIEQNMKAGVLQKYDYGRSENMKIYGTKDPPLYNLSNVTAPFALIYGAVDALAKKKNVEYLAGLLPNVVALVEVPFSLFNHVDFLWATDAKSLLYDQIIELLSKFASNSTNITTPAT